MKHLVQWKSGLKAVQSLFGCSGHKALGRSCFPFIFALLFEYSHVNCCTIELKIQSSKRIQEDFTLFWLSISSGSKSFQLHSKTKKLSTTVEGIRLNWTTEQFRWSKKRMAKRTVPSRYTLLLSFLGLAQHLSHWAWVLWVKSGRDWEQNELGKCLTNLCNTGNATGDQILLSLELWGDQE